jgi:hypothetical protein
MRGRRIRRVIFCAASVASLAVSFDARGLTYTWNKTTGGTWSTGTNWNPTGPPTGNDNALFNLAASYTVTLTAATTITTLTFGPASTGTVTINALSHPLSVSLAHFSAGTINFNSGTLTNPNIANYIDVSDWFNVGTASAISTVGPFSVGSSGIGTLNVTAGTLNSALNFSPDSVIGTTTASGQVNLDFASVGTFGNTMEVEQINGTTGGVLNVFRNSTLTAHSLAIGLTTTGAGTVQLGFGSILGGSITQLGTSTLTVGGATFNGYCGILDIFNGTFTTGTGSILFDSGADVEVDASGVLNANADISIKGLFINSGTLNAGSTTTIRAQTTANAFDEPDDVFFDNPCLDNQAGTISAGTLIVDSTQASMAWVRTAPGKTTPDSMTFGTTIVGAASTGSLQIGETTSNGLSTGVALGHFTTGSLLVGQSAAASGSVEVLGTLTAGSATIGELGQGIVTLDTLSTLTSSGPIVVGDGAASQGTLNIAGGIPNSLSTGGIASLSAAGQSLTVGNAGAGTLEIGFATVTLGTLQVGSMSGGGGLVTQGVGTLVSSLTASTIHLGNSSGGAGTYQMSAGTLNAGSIDITSHGTFMYSGGVINGAIGVNGGTLNLVTPLASGSVTVNYGTNSNILLPRGTLVPLNGNGFGLFAGAGTLNNTGSLSGTGTLFSNETLSNNGTFSSSSGDVVILSGATISNGSAGLLRNGPASNLRIQTTNFTNQGNIEVNAGGAIEMVTDLSIPAAHTMTMKGGLFSNTGQITIASGGSLAGFGQIDSNLVNHGSATFAGSMNVLGNLTSDGTIVARDSTSIVYGSVSNTGSIVVQNGTIVFENSLSAPALGGAADGAGLVNVGSDGKLLSNYVRQTSLNITGSPLDPAVGLIRERSAGGDVSRLSNLGITSGKLDLADTGLIVDYTNQSPINTIRNYLVTGRNGGDWQGLGLTSSDAAAVAADPTNLHKTSLGFAEASALGINSFLGQTVGTTDVVVRYTFNGDANLDGTVNTSDFVRLANGFAHPNALWSDGDFNFDGVVNALDFNALASNFGQAIGSPALASIVPEPAATLTCALAIVLTRRRSRRLDSR